MTPTDLGRVIERLRKQSGQTQYAIAHLCGISKNAPGQWEAGYVYPRFQNLIEFGKVIGVPAWQVLKIAMEEADAKESVHARGTGSYQAGGRGQDPVPRPGQDAARQLENNLQGNSSAKGAAT